MQMLRDLYAAARFKVTEATKRIKARTYSELRASGPGFLEVGRSMHISGVARRKGESTMGMMYRLGGKTPKREERANGN